jgi:hypothetical protein
MRNFFGFFIKDGQTTSIGGLVVIALALAANALVIGLGLNNIFGWVVFELPPKFSLPRVT